MFFQIVYGGSYFGTGSDESRVMSEKVQMLASAIYKELEVMIQRHGQESVKVLVITFNILSFKNNEFFILFFMRSKRFLSKAFYYD